MKSQENSKTENPKASSWSSTKMKDPRIVGVSRAFGKKDRHSKVCTVKGLRDRRVRLSVPTAIQIYDLQDRLGLSQPSKVVDWLLNAAKKDIDELPPLQIPAGSFLSQSVIAMLNAQSDKPGLKINGSNVGFGGAGQSHRLDESCWPYVSSESSFGYRQSFSSYHNSSNQMNASFLRWDSSDFSLSHPPRSSKVLLTSATEQEWHDPSVLQLQQPSLIYHNGIVTQTQPYLPLPRFDSGSEPIREIHFNMARINEDPLHNKGQCFVHNEFK